MDITDVLHKPVPPPNEIRWHIVLLGHPEELLTALDRIIQHEGHVLQCAEWTADDELTICLRWIDEVIPRFTANDIEQLSGQILIKHNGRATCCGHNLT